MQKRMPCCARASPPISMSQPCQRAAQAAYAVARGYSTLEYNVEEGCRGSRHSHAEALLCRITGCNTCNIHLLHIRICQPDIFVSIALILTHRYCDSCNSICS